MTDPNLKPHKGRLQITTASFLVKLLHDPGWLRIPLLFLFPVLINQKSVPLDPRRSCEGDDHPNKSTYHHEPISTRYKLGFRFQPARKKSTKAVIRLLSQISEYCPYHCLLFRGIHAASSEHEYASSTYIPPTRIAATPHYRVLTNLAAH